MTTTAPTGNPTVADVLRAIGKASLLPLLPAEDARLLAAPVARVAAGVELSMEDQRAAARLLQAARQWLEPPLASMGLTIPPPPEPVQRAATKSQAASKVPEAKILGGGRIGVRNLFTITPIVRALPGVQRGGKGSWAVYTLPGTPAAARALLDALEPFGYRVSRKVAELAEAYQVAADARAFLADGAPMPDVDPASYGIQADLWNHQHRSVAYGEASRASLHAIKMGGGKTISAIALANRVQAATVVIICPNRVRAVWTREVRERSMVGWHIEDGTRPSHRRGGRRQNLPHPERLERAQRVLFDCDCGAPVHAFVLNYEALAQRVWQEWVPAQKIDLMIWDEAHRLKAYRTKVPRPKKKRGPLEEALLATESDILDTEEGRARVVEARRLDGMGARERALPADASPKEVKLAQVLDKADQRKEDEARASKLTISGVAMRWVEWSHRRVALTGTPFPQHPWDIFGLYRALDPGVFGSVWTDFKDKFIEMDRSGTYPKKIKPGMLPEFASLSMSLMYRPVVDLKLPGCTDVLREVELEPEARKAYDDLDTRLWADLALWLRRKRGLELDDPDGDPEADLEAEPLDDDGEGPTELNARNVLSRLMRLQQLTGGTLRTDPVKGPHGKLVPGPEARVSRVKTEELAEFENGKLTGGILDEIGCRPDNPGGAEPTIVFCRFTSDLDAVKEIAVKAGLRYGEVSGRRGDGLNSDARMAEDRDLVAVQIQAGGTGVDLTRARYGIWYSLGYSVSDYDQARARLYRPGQKRPVVYIHLVATGTMDQAVYDAIKARKAAISEVLRAGGVDPAAIGLEEGMPGPDPTAERVEGIDDASAAVPLPWPE